ncbi:MAG: peptide chain release factor family protein [Victivallaceae bacterium]
MSGKIDFIISDERDKWLNQSDEELFRSCGMEAFKGSGNGGQKRNKTSSAVRLHHGPTGISVTDCSGRSQHQNRHEAMKKLRFQLALQVRTNSPAIPERLDVSLDSPDYPRWTAAVMDQLALNSFSLKEAAEALELSSARLIKLLYRDPALWQAVNRFREQSGMPLMKINK